jgi:hypothetical protein
MQVRRSRLGRHGAIVAIAAALLGTVSVDLAVAAGPSKTIKACAAKSTGALRIAKHCKKSETTVSWNAVGQRGAKGARGSQGKQGIQGIQGVAGPGAQQIVKSITDLTSGTQATIFPFESANDQDTERFDAECGLEGISTPTAYASLILGGSSGAGSSLVLDGTGTTDVTLGTDGNAGVSLGSTPIPIAAGVSAYAETGNEQDIEVITTSGSPSSLSGTFLVRLGNTLSAVTAYLSVSLTSCELRVIEVPGPVSTP